MTESATTLSELDVILAECLDEVLSGEATVAAAAARYPEHSDALHQMLDVAVLTTRLKAPQMRDEHVDQLEARLIRAMPRIISQQNGHSAGSAEKRNSGRVIAFNPLPRLSRLAAGIVLALLLIGGSGAGLVAAAGDSMPGQTLYPVKQTWERVLVFFATLTGSLDDLRLDLAETRLEEAIWLSQRDKLRPDHLDTLDTATRNLLARHADAETLPAGVQAHLDAVAAFLDPLAAHDEWRDEPALHDLKTLIATSGGAAPPGDGPPGDDNPPPAGASGEGELPDGVEVIPLRGTDDPAQAGATAAQSGTAEGAGDASTPTQTPTSETVPTETLTQTMTPTATAMATAMATATATPTSRIPPTPTRTGTPVPSSTPVPSLPPTPTPTWTAFPTPTIGAVPTLPSLIAPPTGIPTAAGTRPPATRTFWYPWQQATWDTCYLTRTADPFGNVGDPNCP